MQIPDVDTQLIACWRRRALTLRALTLRALTLGLVIGLSPLQPSHAQTPSKEPAGGLTKPSVPMAGEIGARDQSKDIFKTASQAQMRACAFQWREMKRNGKAAGKIWRDFASACLSGR